MSTWYCFGCGKNIGSKERCPYCGMHRSGEEPMSEKEAHDVLTRNGYFTNDTKKKEKKPMFSDEEILAFGLYPKDKGYKASLIMRILGKDR